MKELGVFFAEGDVIGVHITPIPDTNCDYVRGPVLGVGTAGISLAHGGEYGDGTYVFIPWGHILRIYA